MIKIQLRYAVLKLDKRDDRCYVRIISPWSRWVRLGTADCYMTHDRSEYIKRIAAL